MAMLWPRAGRPLQCASPLSGPHVPSSTRGARSSARCTRPSIVAMAPTCSNGCSPCPPSTRCTSRSGTRISKARRMFARSCHRLRCRPTPSLGVCSRVPAARTRRRRHRETQPSRRRRWTASSFWPAGWRRRSLPDSPARHSTCASSRQCMSPATSFCAGTPRWRATSVTEGGWCSPFLPIGWVCPCAPAPPCWVVRLPEASARARAPPARQCARCALALRCSHAPSPPCVWRRSGQTRRRPLPPAQWPPPSQPRPPSPSRWSAARRVPATPTSCTPSAAGP
mmetsp:Transcript_24655/g.79612  ORF Transcript_24655/g.79612 Transcript_24655/m.79612 type:complete len:282 (-) Transcript_24655:72-917(-)